MKYIKEELESLDYEERANLREFLSIQRKRTIEMPINDSAVSGLLNRRVLYPTSNTVRIVRIAPSIKWHMCNCSVNPEFKKYIDDKVLGLPMSDDELSINRPEWVKYQIELSKNTLLYS